jgi:hypothetical protein
MTYHPRKPSEPIAGMHAGVEIDDAPESGELVKPIL